ncbi:hypothetical protein TNCV_3079741 [Trichonephila clavipes]|nr:hypothetical protein TNCV_3079741 [Trichonephila clavipes]
MHKPKKRLTHSSAYLVVSLFALRITSHTRLNDSLIWRALRKLLEAVREWFNGYKWPPKGPPIMEPTPNKWCCHQEGQTRSPKSFGRRQRRNSCTTVPKLAHNLTESRISRQTVYGRLQEIGLPNWGIQYWASFDCIQQETLNVTELKTSVVGTRRMRACSFQ